MKLLYLSSVGVPTDWAHGIQIMKMCEAFANIGVQVELVVPRRATAIKSDPFDYYGIRKNFTITTSCF